MKKPEQYFDSSGWGDQWPWTIEEQVVEAIKAAQIDAIEATCKRCAEEAMLGNTENGVYNVLEVSKDSILKVADKMKEELK